MTDKIVIDVFRKKTIEEFSEILSEEKARIETGSASAAAASFAAALLKRAADSVVAENERLEYIKRNSEIIRNYMTYLVDEDVKCRGPMRKALKEGDCAKIEACIQPACAINSEIINMMQNLLEFCEEIFDYAPDDEKHYIVEAANLALSAVRMSVSYILNAVKSSSDDTYLYVTRRENEIFCSKCEEIAGRINKKSEMPF